MTSEELVIAIRIAADDTEREIAAIGDWFSRVAQDAQHAGSRVEGAFFSGMLSPFSGMLSAIAGQMSAMPQARLTVDNSQAIGAIDAAMGAVSAFLKLLGVAGLASGDNEKAEQTTATQSGGGYSGRASQEAQALREAERMQEEAYRSEVERVEHRRRLGEISAQEEIDLLEQVKRRYAQTAAQIMDIDETIFDARMDLRDAEQEKISSLGEAVTDALRAQYEAQRDQEQAHIEESIASWEAWSDETCAAIRKQMDALEEQAQAEDREAKAAEHLRKIDSLSQALRYETDAYNRKQLEKQIAQAEEAWVQLQSGWARADQRDALADQMAAVKAEAQQRIEALEQESERIDGVYDAMVDGANLAAKAQKTLMESSQEELLALLTAYAPDYEATGRTLGERLYAGFSQAFGDVTAWFDELDTRFEAMMDHTGWAALASAEGASGGQASVTTGAPQVSQTVNFYQPVESAADVARRMQRVSEELAAMM